MKDRFSGLLLTLLSLLMFQSGVRAQFLWHITHNETDSWRYTYSFGAVSCNGDNCTATGIVTDYLKSKVIIAFWNSSDGGNTWRLQDPNLPWTIGQSRNQCRIIQQIDSLNIVAVGDSGLILHTSNGGETWETQNCPMKIYLNDVNFSDTQNGIIVGIDFNTNTSYIFRTSDGGRHWDSVLFKGLGINFTQCCSYGNNMFRAFTNGSGKIYTTYNNWNTVDSSEMILDSSNDPNSAFFLERCNFSGGDTIFAYGRDFRGGSVIIRSTNGGNSWQKPINFLHMNVDNIYYMTAIRNDTMLASGTSFNRILFSSDHGISWRVDSLFLDTLYSATFCNGLTATSGGHFVGAFSSSPTLGANGILIHDGVSKSIVNTSLVNSDHIFVFPNPTAATMHVTGAGAYQTIHIVNLLGQEVMKGTTSTDGVFSCDISYFPQGIYNIICDKKKKVLFIGKFIVEGLK